MKSTIISPGLKNFDDILTETDGVMVARGENIGVRVVLPAPFLPWAIQSRCLIGARGRWNSSDVKRQLPPEVVNAED